MSIEKIFGLDSEAVISETYKNFEHGGDMKTKREFNLEMNSIRDLKIIIETMEELTAMLTSHPSIETSRIQLEIIQRFKDRLDSNILDAIEEKLIYKVRGE